MTTTLELTTPAADQAAGASTATPQFNTTVDRKALLVAGNGVAASLTTRPAAPVLAGIVLEATGGHLTLSAWNFDHATRDRIPAVTTTPGRLLVHGRLLHDLLKKLDAEHVTLVAEGSKLIVQAGPTRYTLQTLPVEDYPQLPAIPAAGGTVDAPALVAAIKRVFVSVGRDDTIPMLTGIQITGEGKTLMLAGTDRFRLATAEVPWIPDDLDAETWTALLPAKFLKTVATRWAKAVGDLRLTWQHEAGAEAAAEAKALQTLAELESRMWHGHPDVVKARDVADRRTEARVQAEHRAGLAGLAFGEQHTTGRCLKSEYVRYRSLFPTQNTGAVADTKALLAAVERVALVADRTSPIRLSFDGASVLLEAGAGDEAQASEPVRATWPGETPLVASFNPGFLIDGLKTLNTRYVRFGFTIAAKPAVLTGHHSPVCDDFDGYRYLMMPLRVPGQATDPTPPEPETGSKPSGPEQALSDVPAAAAA
ncbi:DNA polymerase III subunit beta [Catenulispora sp. NL8]|uniref:DNA polymerase III subunit beta n=1 Tax=Catenulispora pinistramenti TaxID=2705254 RepID=A0ABS5KWS9_9ACTN|nr:DNA polymerase III subunit beta [Catenulispora pinistramenti]MBS2550487.1 DNA polymerase III subunit beta [Catenulispora pinistramenti]